MRQVVVVPGGPVREYVPAAADLPGGGNVVVWRTFVVGVLIAAVELGWLIGGAFL